MGVLNPESEMRRVEINISWVYAVNICIEVLRNPDASLESIKTCKEELLRLAKWADDDYPGPDQR